MNGGSEPGWRARLLDRAFALLGTLAVDTADRAGAALGLLAFHLGIRRRVVRSNLRRALGLSAMARRRVARQAYATMGANFLALAAARGGLRGCHLEVVNPAWCRHLQARHGGCVFLTLHLGCWDLAAHAAARFWPRVLVYATAQHDPAADACIDRCRTDLGMEVIKAKAADRRGAVRVVRALRREPIAVGLLADQGPQPEHGGRGWFLGQATTAHQGPAVIAVRSGAPLVAGFCLRTAAGRFRFVLGRAVTVAPGEEEVATQWGLDALSAVVAAFPGQYFWHHRRFKFQVDLPGRPQQPWRRRGLGLALSPTPADLSRAAGTAAGGR